MTNYFVAFFAIVTIILIIILQRKFKSKIENIKTYFLVTFVLLLVCGLIIYPNDTINASLNGLKTWSNIVLPSLMPFFIGSEILIGLGVVNFIGILLKPIMYPIFGVSGEGSFPFAMSIASGYPVGVTLVSKLRQQNIIGRIEAQRLVSFCSTSGPLFMIGAVSIGMFKNSSIGTLLSISHYLGAITVGLIFKNYGNDNIKINHDNKDNYLKKAFNELIKTRKRDGRSLSMLMSDAIKSSIEAMLMIGGFIIVYSVVIEILIITGVVNFLTNLIIVAIPINIDIKLVEGFISGLLEMTNGCKLVSMANSSSIIAQVCTVSFLIGWSGLSIQSQAASMLSNTDISSKLYMFSKILHAFISTLYCYVLYRLFFKNIVVVSFLSEDHNVQNGILGNWFKILKFSVEFELVILLIIIFISLIIGTLYSIKSIFIERQ